MEKVYLNKVIQYHFGFVDENDTETWRRLFNPNKEMLRTNRYEYRKVMRIMFYKFIDLDLFLKHHRHLEKYKILYEKGIIKKPIWFEQIHEDICKWGFYLTRFTFFDKGLEEIYHTLMNFIINHRNLLKTMRLRHIPDVSIYDSLIKENAIDRIDEQTFNVYYESETDRFETKEERMNIPKEMRGLRK